MPLLTTTDVFASDSDAIQIGGTLLNDGGVLEGSAPLAETDGTPARRLGSQPRSEDAPLFRAFPPVKPLHTAPVSLTSVP